MATLDEFLYGKKYKDPKTGKDIKVTSFAVPPVFGGIGTKMFGVAGGGVGLTKTAVNIPWKPIAIGAGGLFAGYTLFGKKGQEQAVSQATEQKQDLKAAITPSYTVGRDWQPLYDQRAYTQYDIISGGQGSIYSEKKIEAQGGQTPTYTMPNIISQAPTQAAAQGAEQGQAAGTDFMLVAAIAAVGLVAYGYVSKPKGRK